MSDVDTMVEMTYLSNPLREPVIRSAIQALRLSRGSRGLDAGCGIGLQALLLAEAVGPGGHVTGLDLSEGLLVRAAELVNQACMTDRIDFRLGDIGDLPFDDDSFDWAWSADCVGYAPVPAVPLLMELARVVRPGGVVAILAWSSERLLPGYPVLEARLSRTTPGIAPFVAARVPASHLLRLLGRFREAGLEHPRVRTFVGDAHAPLADDIRRALIALFEMRWPGVERELTPQERSGYRRLCLPDSPDFILNSPDYYAFFTYSMFQGTVPG